MLSSSSAVSIITTLLVLLLSSFSFIVFAQQQTVTDPTQPHPIRISFFGDALFSPSQVCSSASSSNSVVDPLTGDTYSCAHPDDVLTGTKRDTLTQKIVPFIAQKLSNVLNVKWKRNAMMTFIAPHGGTTTTTTTTSAPSSPSSTADSNMTTTSTTTMTTTTTTTTAATRDPSLPPARIFVPSGSVCDFFSIPASHRPPTPPQDDPNAPSSDNLGIPNADVVIYLSAMPGNRTSLTWPAAVGQGCIHEGDLFRSSSSSSSSYERIYSNLRTGNGRPVVANVNVPPASIHSLDSSTPNENDLAVKRVMKGVFQALGFSWEYLDQVERSSQLYEVDTANEGTTTTEIPSTTSSSSSTSNSDFLHIPSYIQPPRTTPLKFYGQETLRLARDYFACSSILFVPFVNVSSQRVVGFDSRVLKDEVLSVSFKSTNSRVMSKMAVAALVDFNNESYSINYNRFNDNIFEVISENDQKTGFETMLFGVNGTCNFIAHSCYSSLNDEWFCPSPSSDPSSSSNDNLCSYDYSGRGRCEGQVCPSCLVVNSSSGNQFIADPVTKRLPENYTLDDSICIIPSNDQPPSEGDVLRGERMNTMSRCFVASTLQIGKTDPSPRPTRCFVSRCDPMSGKVQFKVNNNNNNDWITCDSDGELKNAVGYSGSVICPKRRLFCAAYTSWTTQAHLQGLGGEIIGQTTTSGAPTQSTSLGSTTSDASNNMSSSTSNQNGNNNPTSTTDPLFTTAIISTQATTTTQAPPLPPNPTEIALTFYASPMAFTSPSNNNMNNCTPSRADSIMRNLVRNNASAIRTALASDISRLLLISHSELIVNTVIAVDASNENPTPAAMKVFISIRPIPDIMSVFNPYTSATLTASWCEELTRVANYTYAQHSCALSGLRQGAAQDVTPLPDEGNGCFINGDCPTTIGLVFAIVIVVGLVVAIVWWRVFHVSPDDLIVVDENGHAPPMAGEETINVFGSGGSENTSVMMMPVSANNSDVGGYVGAGAGGRHKKPNAKSSIGELTDQSENEHDLGGENSSGGGKRRGSGTAGPTGPNHNNNSDFDDDQEDQSSLIVNAADAGDRHQPFLNNRRNNNNSSSRRNSSSVAAGNNNVNPLAAAVANAAGAGGGPGGPGSKFDPYMPTRRATSYAAYFKQNQNVVPSSQQQQRSNPLGPRSGSNRKRFHHSGGGGSGSGGSGRNSRSSSVHRGGGNNNNDDDEHDPSGYLLGSERGSVMGQNDNNVPRSYSPPQHQYSVNGDDDNQQQQQRHQHDEHMITTHNFDLSEGEATLDDL